MKKNTITKEETQSLARLEKRIEIAKSKLFSKGKTIKGTDLDEGAIMNAETQKLLHTMSLEIIQVVFNNMPNILDGIAADMRLKADKNYKCALQPEEYKNKDCK